MTKLLILFALSFLFTGSATSSNRFIYNLVVSQSPIFSLSEFANLKLRPTTTAAKSRFRVKSTSGYIITKVFNGSNCEQSPHVVSGRVTNTCFEASDNGHNIVGSIMYQVENNRLVTSEYDSIDCSGEAFSVTSAQISTEQCWSNPAEGTSTMISFEEEASPWISLQAGVNIMQYNKEESCTRSPNGPSLFEWFALNHCFPVTFGPEETTGSLQYTGCSQTTFSLVAYADPHCTRRLQTYSLDRPLCMMNTYGEDASIQRHVNAYETISCTL